MGAREREKNDQQRWRHLCRAQSDRRPALRGWRLGYGRVFPGVGLGELEHQGSEETKLATHQAEEMIFGAHVMSEIMVWVRALGSRNHHLLGIKEMGGKSIMQRARDSLLRLAQAGLRWGRAPRPT